MEKRYLAFEIQSKESNPDQNPYGGFSGFATRPVTDRVGDIVNPMGIQNLQEYMKNPVVLWNHSPDKPIGHTTSMEPRPDGLWTEGRFDADPESQKIKSKLEGGTLNALSIGFRPLKSHPISSREDAEKLCAERGLSLELHNHNAEIVDGRFIDTWELFEQSVVSVPANQDALITFVKSLEEPEPKPQGQTLVEIFSELDERVEEEKAGRIISLANRGRIQKLLEVISELNRVAVTAKRGLQELLTLSEPPSADADKDAPDTPRDENALDAISTKLAEITNLLKEE